MTKMFMAFESWSRYAIRRHHSTTNVFNVQHTTKISSMNLQAKQNETKKINKEFGAALNSFRQFFSLISRPLFLWFWIWSNSNAIDFLHLNLSQHFSHTNIFVINIFFSLSQYPNTIVLDEKWNVTGNLISAPLSLYSCVILKSTNEDRIEH